MTNSIADIEDAACVFVIGSNTTECHPLVARRVIRAKEKGATLLVADPRRIHLAGLADLAVQHRPGTDVALLNGVMHAILKGGRHDAEYVAARCEGFDELAATLEEYPPDKVEAVTGVPARDIERLAELYSSGKPASLLYAMGITQHTSGVSNVLACCNLAMLCGNIGVPGGGVNPLRGQNNVQGACDMGGLPNVFTAYQPVADHKANDKFSRAWGPLPRPRPGLTVTEMIPAALEGRLKALYVIGENPVLSDADSDHVVQALENLEFLLVQDIFPTETAGLAHVVLAAAATAEKEGTFTNTERRCSRLFKAVEPPGEALADWEILCRLFRAMGRDAPYDGPEAVFAEMASLTPSYAGMSYERLGAGGLQWPCPEPGHPGTPYLHAERMAKGKGAFHAVRHAEPAELPDGEYPLYLTTGRIYAHFHTGTMTRRSPGLEAEQDHCYVEMNAADAAGLGIGQGDAVRVATRRGAIETRARISPRVRPGQVFVPFHFAESPANRLTNPALDSVAKIPEFKVCAARVERLAP